MVMFGSVSVPCARTSVFFRLMVRLKSLQASEKRSIRLWSSAWRRLFTSGEGAKPCQQFVRVVGLMSFFLVLIFFFICKEKKGMFSFSDPPLEGRVGSRRGRSLTFFVSS